MTHNDSLFINIHKAAQGQTVTARIQGADPIRKSVGKHRDHTIHKVDAGSTLICLLIERTVLLHIVAHIRNVDTEMIDSLPIDCLL